jgi:hypothetical protein
MFEYWSTKGSFSCSSELIFFSSSIVVAVVALIMTAENLVPFLA